MPRRKKPVEEIVRVVSMTEIVGTRAEVERAEATVHAVLLQTGCKVRSVFLSDPPKVPHAG